MAKFHIPVRAFFTVEAEDEGNAIDSLKILLGEAQDMNWDRESVAGQLVMEAKIDETAVIKLTR